MNIGVFTMFPYGTALEGRPVGGIRRRGVWADVVIGPYRSLYEFPLCVISPAL